MQRNYLILAAASLAVILLSCKKDIVERENTYPTSLNSTGALNTMLAQNAPQTQMFTFNAATGMNFIGTSGTKVIIPSNAFVYSNMQPVVGNVDVTMIEVYNKKGMICSGGFTTANGLPLVSGGEVCIRAWQGNLPLEYNPSAQPMSLMFPTQNPDAQMELFVAEDIREGADFNQVDSSLWITTDTSWTPVPAPYFYAVWSMSLGWINCDYFYNYNGDKTEVTVSTPTIFNGNNSMMLCVLEDYNSVAQIYHYDASTEAFLLDQGYQIPVGTHVKFICMSDINGTLYWGETTLQEIQDGHVTSVTPQIVTQTEFDQKLDGLN